jgi:hypothetical protein
MIFLAFSIFYIISCIACRYVLIRYYRQFRHISPTSRDIIECFTPFLNFITALISLFLIGKEKTPFEDKNTFATRFFRWDSEYRK